MSWQANRYKKGPLANARRRKAAPRPMHRTDEGELLTYLARSHAIEMIFGSPSVEHATKVLLRLGRAKGRSLYPAPFDQPWRDSILQGKNHSAKRRTKKSCRKWNYQLRNYHHLTPKSKAGSAAYYGNGPGNKLFIKVERHNAWHHTFGLRTLEEITRILIKYRMAMRLQGRHDELASIEVPKGRTWVREQPRGAVFSASV